MNRLWVLVLLLAPFALTLEVRDMPAQERAPAPQQPKAVIKPTGDLYYVSLSGVQSWKFLSRWCDEILREQGKGLYRNVHGRVYDGKQGNKKDLMEGLDWMLENAKENDLVFLFITTHGTCVGGKDGVSVLQLSPDVQPREIKAKLAKLPCQAIVCFDACHVGNWTKEFPPDDVMPPNVTALCACDSTQVTGIEFPITLFEGLFGKADYNKDGIVDVDELLKYTKARIREVQHQFGEMKPTLHKAKKLDRALPLTKARHDLVTVIQKQGIWAGILDKEEGEKFHVRVIGFEKPGGPGVGISGAKMPNQFSRADLILPKDGAPLMVKKDNGGWHPACLVSKEGEKYKVRYVGSDGDAVVNSADVRHLFAGNPSEDFPRIWAKK